MCKNYKNSAKIANYSLKSCKAAHIKNMKSKTVLKTLATSFILTAGLATPAAAQHCNVVKGDTVWEIAQRYKIKFKELCDMNAHFADLDVIFPKDKIELPDHAATGQQTSEHSQSDDIKEGTEQSTERGDSSQAQDVLKLVNQEREKNGLQPLTLSNELTKIANTKAQDMATKHYFSHTSPTLGTPFEMLQNYGVKYSHAGENIASGQKSAAQVMNDWMNSSGHRANILSKDYTQLGVGYATGGEYGTYWVQLFIKP